MVGKQSVKRTSLALLIILYFAGAYSIMNYYDISCVFLELCGIPCPGCGMTRAFLSLLRLDFYSAFKYNFIVFFMPYVFMYIIFDFRSKVHNKILFVIAVLAIVNWIIKLLNIF
jgi:hypothetical protein